MTSVGKYANTKKGSRMSVVRVTRPISWVNAARKAFMGFPDASRDIMLDALTMAAEGGKADIAKPMVGFGSGVFEIALPYRGNAYRVIYAVQIGEDIWVLHAFQKKSTSGIKTPKHEVDIAKKRLKQLKEMLR